MPVDTIFEELGKMTVLELVELKNKIEEEWGITAAAPVAAAAAAAPADGGGDCNRSGGGDAPLLFDLVLELDQLEDGHGPELLEDGVNSHV